MQKYSSKFRNILKNNNIKFYLYSIEKTTKIRSLKDYCDECNIKLDGVITDEKISSTPNNKKSII